jgi:hypothetical protein
MLLDTDDSSMQERGKSALLSLMQDEDNRYKDIAFYYLGRFYFVNDQLDSAQKIWKELVDSQHMEQAAYSPWASLAQQKLDQIA